MSLSFEQCKTFFYDGHIVVPDVVPQKLCLDAIRAINQDIGKGMSLEDAKKAQAGSWCPSLVAKPVITDLYNKTDILKLVSSLLGTTVPLFGGQIALRFPGTLCTDPNSFNPVPYWNKIWHIDGFHSPENRIPKGQIHNFTMLIGIVLSDVVEEMNGNLVVYPGSHHLVENYMNKLGVIENIKEKGVDGLPGMPLPPAKQVIAKMGSVVLAHYSLAHSIAPNVSPYIRYAVYFRANVRKSQDLIPLKNIWVDYKGLLIERIVIHEKSKIKFPDDKVPLVVPGYVDVKHRANIMEFMKKEEQLNEVLAKGDSYFNAHQWDLAKPYFLELASQRQDDWMVLLKVSVCLSASTNEIDVPKAHPYLKKLIEMFSSAPNGYSLMAQNLARLKKFKEALVYIAQMMTCPPLLDQADSVFDGLKCAQNCMIQLNMDHKNLMKKYIDKALNDYPMLSERMKSLASDQDMQILWKKGQDFLQTIGNGPKWNEGIKIYSEILLINPKDFWAMLLCGACYTWGGNAKEGEKFLRNSIELDPKMPHGYSGLAQNLQLQGKKKECQEILMSMIQTKFSEVESNRDHEEKIIEAISVGKNILSSGDYQHLVISFKKMYKLGSLDKL